MKKLPPIKNLKRKPKTLQELFRSPKRWIQGRYKDRRNYEDSTCFCLIGGIQLIYKNPNEIENKVAMHLGVMSISYWNDKEYRTIEDIQNLVKELDI